MEVEMKALITIKQAEDLVNGNIGNYHISRGGGWLPFRKIDTYYSLNGEKVINNDMIRIREEMEIGEDTFLDIILGNAKKIKAGTKKTFLTVKKKTVNNGIETNEEIENIMLGKEAFEKSMEICGWKPYFQKKKDSVSLYVRNENGFEFHCEIVNVNGIGPYLEIEAVVDEDTEEAKEIIENFFFDAFGITDFDGRSWGEIIND